MIQHTISINTDLKVMETAEYARALCDDNLLRVCQIIRNERPELDFQRPTNNGEATIFIENLIAEMCVFESENTYSRNTQDSPIAWVEWDTEAEKDFKNMLYRILASLA